MKCPHLGRLEILTCKVEEKPYIPSLFELQEYCKGERHRRCPFYLRNIIIEDERNSLISVSRSPYTKSPVS